MTPKVFQQPLSCTTSAPNGMCIVPNFESTVKNSLQSPRTHVLLPSSCLVKRRRTYNFLDQKNFMG